MQHRIPASRRDGIKVGDLIRVSGQFEDIGIAPVARPFCTRMKLITTSYTNIMPSLTGRQIHNFKSNGKVVKTSGRLQDAFQDDIDQCHYWLTIDSSDGAVNAVIPSTTNLLPYLRRLIGATVSVHGLIRPQSLSSRPMQGPFLMLQSQSSISVLDQPQSNLFSAPVLNHSPNSPETISCLGHRSIIGTIRCIWGGRNVLVETDKGFRHNAEIADAEMPKAGQVVKLVGLPETDLFRINLSHASWMTDTGEAKPLDTPRDVSINTLLNNPQSEHGGINIQYHGEHLRVVGEVVGLPSQATPSGIVNIRDGKNILQIDICACPDVASTLTLGCQLSISGICVITTENWRPNHPLPRITGILLAVRSPKDIVILSHPSWLTTRTLVKILVSVLFSFAGVLIWNIALRVLVARRSRALFQAQIDKVSSELRIAERTRLAVELHDALSQNLAGVAMEIEAATRNEPKGLAAVLSHVKVADQALRSCRLELKNSLWDLRNNALEANNLKIAVERTLLPHLKGIDSSVRMDVSRARLSDSTTHDILCIIRELVLNGIHHGHATKLRVAGSVEEDTIKISVRDNGMGFDPDTCPGVENGHFGLEGIRERISKFDGSLTFERQSDNGMRAIVSIRIPGVEKNL